MAAAEGIAFVGLGAAWCETGLMRRCSWRKRSGRERGGSWDPSRLHREDTVEHTPDPRSLDPNLARQSKVGIQAFKQHRIRIAPFVQKMTTVPVAHQG